LDSNHNRILGMSGFGHCSGSGALCSIGADCPVNETCDLLPGQIAPQFILGQPSGYDAGACNGDAYEQLLPNRNAARADSLCFFRPSEQSVGESVVLLQAAVDSHHNLYVPDQWNNRVLMYRDPFDPGNGTNAAAVWGQSDYAGVQCNSSFSTMNSLCLP